MNDDNHTEERRIDAVDELDNWQIHEDDTDIRGWDLYTAQGEKIGEIETLIADTHIRKVRYAEVELEDDIRGLRDRNYYNTISPEYQTYYGDDDDDDRYSLVPIGMLRIDHENEKVIASSNLAHTHFANSPRHKGIKNTPVTPPYELTTMRYYSDLDDHYRDTYNDQHYDFKTYQAEPYIKEDSFYSSDFFSGNRYLERYRGHDTTMAGFNTGAIGR